MSYERLDRQLKTFSARLTEAVGLEEQETGKVATLIAAERSTVLRAIERQLLQEPLTETRQRKPLRPNPVAPWELRVGQLRVFYEVAGIESGVVRILAVGRKDRNVLMIGGKEIRL
jgi:mRNA-degrading endonuclease RelE of RelBE toxin-antitoxin system